MERNLFCLGFNLIVRCQIIISKEHFDTNVRGSQSKIEPYHKHFWFQIDEIHQVTFTFSQIQILVFKQFQFQSCLVK